MMNGNELVEKLARSAFVQEELPMQMQLGLPSLERRNGKVCLCFYPHREEYKDGQIRYYPNAYEVAWVYPFEHLAWFRDVRFDRAVDLSQPVKVIEEKRMLTVGLNVIQELYDGLTKALTLLEEHGDLNDAMLNRYRKQYREAVQTLGLEKLYPTEEA